MSGFFRFPARAGSPLHRLMSLRSLWTHLYTGALDKVSLFLQVVWAEQRASTGGMTYCGVLDYFMMKGAYACGRFIRRRWVSLLFG